MLLSSADLSRETFKAGDKISVTGHPAKSGAPRLTLDRFLLPDGRVLPEKHKGNGTLLDEVPK